MFEFSLKILRLRSKKNRRSAPGFNSADKTVGWPTSRINGVSHLWIDCVSGIDATAVTSLLLSIRNVLSLL